MDFISKMKLEPAKARSEKFSEPGSYYEITNIEVWREDSFPLP
jgi:hypothetical protein